MQQKQEKKQSLVESAYELFLHKGFQKTSIDEIVKNAKVAKGTFYLYFRDKSDIMQHIVLHISCRVLKDAYDNMMANDTGDFVENIILIADFIINYFTKNKLVLQMVERNFSWPLIREKLDDEQFSVLNDILASCFSHPYLEGHSQDEIYKLLFVIIELCGSISYTSIIMNQPDTIENMKPFLYDIIRKILRKEPA
ncbi:TetR/AcrR family transcriptional regulator [Zongyangia hominis]|uniref:TetR/AcrR family transcriptional regulator n=1 Tax=Zongyangia hominis TaxID=2763677 RepID=A0A926IBF1_9FIRM|nr:TetR/AcrR family transcriptional regulator [Zongyangia hominis]MBC8571171.1 TetR/AcrR family transcriptional regulator [Zongyangia hominis]